MAEQNREKNTAGKKPGKLSVLTGAAAAVLVAGAVGILALATPMLRYNTAVRLMDNGNYEQAAEDFAVLGDYRDSEEKALEALALMAQEDDTCQ